MCNTTFGKVNSNTWLYYCFSVMLALSFSHAKGSTSLVFQQSKIIKGIISDAESGDRVAGATIQVKGTSRGTSSDGDGSFSLEAKEGDILEISFIGYETFTLNVTEQNTYTIMLVPSAKSLSEVVIVGSRNQNRTVIESPVPVDVIDVSNLVQLWVR
jgi:iron complex outermembrane recepter protein